MTLTELKARIKSADVRGWYIICGEEEYLKRYYKKEIKNLLVPENDPFALFNHATFDGQDFDSLAFTEAIKTPPMMSDNKLIEWQFADLSKLKEKDVDRLVTIAEEKNDYPYATVIITTLPDGFDVGTSKKPTEQGHLVRHRHCDT